MTYDVSHLQAEMQALVTERRTVKDGSRITIEVGRHAAAPVCCGRLMVRKAVKEITCADIPDAHGPVLLFIRKTRFRCKTCGTDFTPALHGTLPKLRMTKRLADLVMDRHRDGTAALASQVGLSSHAVRTVVRRSDAALPAALPQRAVVVPAMPGGRVLFLVFDADTGTYVDLTSPEARGFDVLRAMQDISCSASAQPILAEHGIAAAVLPDDALPLAIANVVLPAILRSLGKAHGDLSLLRARARMTFRPPQTRLWPAQTHPSPTQIQLARSATPAHVPSIATPPMETGMSDKPAEATRIHVLLTATDLAEFSRLPKATIEQMPAPYMLLETIEKDGFVQYREGTTVACDDAAAVLRHVGADPVIFFAADRLGKELAAAMQSRRHFDLRVTAGAIGEPADQDLVFLGFQGSPSLDLPEGEVAPLFVLQWLAEIHNYVAGIEEQKRLFEL